MRLRQVPLHAAAGPDPHVRGATVQLGFRRAGPAVGAVRPPAGGLPEGRAERRHLPRQPHVRLGVGRRVGRLRPSQHHRAVLPGGLPRQPGLRLRHVLRGAAGAQGAGGSHHRGAQLGAVRVPGRGQRQRAPQHVHHDERHGVRLRADPAACAGLLPPPAHLPLGARARRHGAHVVEGVLPGVRRAVARVGAHVHRPARVPQVPDEQGPPRGRAARLRADLRHQHGLRPRHLPHQVAGHLRGPHPGRQEAQQPAARGRPVLAPLPQAVPGQDAAARGPAGQHNDLHQLAATVDAAAVRDAGAVRGRQLAGQARGLQHLPDDLGRARPARGLGLRRQRHRRRRGRRQDRGRPGRRPLRGRQRRRVPAVRPGGRRGHHVLRLHGVGLQEVRQPAADAGQLPAGHGDVRGHAVGRGLRHVHRAVGGVHAPHRRGAHLAVRHPGGPVPHLPQGCVGERGAHLRPRGLALGEPHPPRAAQHFLRCPVHLHYRLPRRLLRARVVRPQEEGRRPVGQ